MWCFVKKSCTRCDEFGIHCHGKGATHLHLVPFLLTAFFSLWRFLRNFLVIALTQRSILIRDRMFIIELNMTSMLFPACELLCMDSQPSWQCQCHILIWASLMEYSAVCPFSSGFKWTSQIKTWCGFADLLTQSFECGSYTKHKLINGISLPIYSSYRSSYMCVKVSCDWLLSFVTVSYTHLDVYKRQLL